MASRKLAGAIAAMWTAAALLIGLALIDPAILVDNKELLFVTLGGIFGLGGWQIAKQAQVDQSPNTPPPARDELPAFTSKTNGG